MKSSFINHHSFNFTDHLGNVRVVASADGRVLEANDYYPYGMLMGNSSSDYQPFKYSSKELDRMNGLNLYDHGARMSDPALGRWHSVDPLAEKYYDLELSRTDVFVAQGKEKGVVKFHRSSSGNWLNLSTIGGHGITSFKKDIMQWLPESATQSFKKMIWEEKDDKEEKERSY